MNLFETDVYLRNRKLVNTQLPKKTCLVLRKTLIVICLYILQIFKMCLLNGIEAKELELFLHDYLSKWHKSKRVGSFIKKQLHKLQFRSTEAKVTLSSILVCGLQKHYRVLLHLLTNLFLLR